MVRPGLQAYYMSTRLADYRLPIFPQEKTHENNRSEFITACQPGITRFG